MALSRLRRNSLFSVDGSCESGTKEHVICWSSSPISGWGIKSQHSLSLSWRLTKVFQRFQELAPDLIPYDMTSDEGSRLKIPLETVENMPELKENPFKRRICHVFSDDGTGNISFDDFLDMFSVFSEAAPRNIKSTYAFRIYDYDGDNLLGKSDLVKTLTALTQNSLTTEEMDFVVEKVLEETDLDDDGMLSYIEFEHVISRAPEFLNTFHIRI